MDFSDRIKSLRGGMGLNQKEFAELLGVSQSRYNQWESGKNRPDYKVLIFVADKLKTTVDFLIGRFESGSLDIDYLAIENKLGISPEAIQNIENNEDIANKFIGNERFTELMTYIARYIDAEIENLTSNSNKEALKARFSINKLEKLVSDSGLSQTEKKHYNELLGRLRDGFMLPDDRVALYTDRTEKEFKKLLRSLKDTAIKEGEQNASQDEHDNK